MSETAALSSSLHDEPWRYLSFCKRPYLGSIARNIARLPWPTCSRYTVAGERIRVDCAGATRLNAHEVALFMRPR